MSPIQRAEKIRGTVQADLDSRNLAVLAGAPEISAAPRIGLPRYLSGIAAHHLAAGQRSYEMLSVALLAGEVGLGFEADTDPIDDTLAAEVINVTEQCVQGARAAIDSFIWPAPTSDHVQAAHASQAIARHAALLQFVELFG